MNIRHIIYIIAALAAVACQDDLITLPGGVVPGEDTKAEITVCFDPEDAVALNSRAMTSEDGDAIQDINSFWMLLYDTDGLLVKKYHILEGGKAVSGTDGISNVNYRRADNRLPSEGDLQDNSSGRLTFTLDATSEYYYIYGVANVPEVKDLAEGSHRDALKRMARKWDVGSLAANSEMFGIFSVGANRDATDASPMPLRAKDAQIHCWLRRLASKVTVAFDGRELYDNVQVFIDTIMLCDIPKQCMLGERNYPGRDLDDLETWYPTEERYTHENGVIAQGPVHEVQKLTAADIRDISPDNYFHVCNTAHPYLGKGDTGADSTIIDNTHLHTAKSLFFYENLQGPGKLKHQSKDGVHIDFPTPEVGDPESGWKDAKPYGTYVEVRGFYRCVSPDGSIGSGWIKYRFMLGQDIDYDYDALRNTHYKLTLRLRGYGNDYDWHIDYKEKTGIFITTPQYISYLYNKSMYATVKIVGEMEPGTTLKAEIVDDVNFSGAEKWERSYWRPWGNGTDAFPDPDKAVLPGTTNIPVYYDHNRLGGSLNSYADGPWTSFLSLRKTKLLRLEPTGWEGTASNKIGVAEALEYCKTYYEQNKIGYREYAITPGNSDMNDDNVGKYTMQVTRRDPNDTTKILERLYRIPLYTRAKELVTRTGFTGNNPFSAYPRKGKIKFTASIKDEDTGQYTERTFILDMIQVRRVVNPKGVWRRGSGTAVSDFHVRLMRQPSDDASNFVSFTSVGKWSAEVIRTSDPIISLSSTAVGTGPGTQQQSHQSRIEGESECPIDFDINFNGGKGFAVVRVRYHNYTCEHDIFVRVGYGPVEIVPGSGTWWNSYNVHHFEGDSAVLCTSPLQEGSLFRRGSGTAILAKNSKVNTIGTNVPSRAMKTIMATTKGKEEDRWWGGCAPTETDRQTWEITKDAEGAIKSVLHDWKIGNADTRIATIEDFYTITSVTNDPNFKYSKAYGVLYGDGAVKVAESMNDAYGYDSETGDDSPKGMRGVFVYNTDNLRMIFLPIGLSGYGRRLGGASWADEPTNGTQRYASRGARMSNADASDRPLFYDLYRRPGALYWCKIYKYPIDKRPVKIPDGKGGFVTNYYNDVEKSASFDINYFTMGFEGFDNASVTNDNGKACDGSMSDACFIRTVRTKP